MGQLLRMAVLAGVESAVRVHIDRGDDLNARDASGMTPLMLTAVRNRPAICRVLLSAGADHGLFDPSGRTALEIAIAAGSEDTAAILGAVHTPALTTHRVSEVALDPESDAVFEQTPVDSHCAPETTVNVVTSASAAPREPEPDFPVPKLGPVALPLLNIEVDNGGDFVLSGWEAEVEARPPKADVTVLDSASAIQRAITRHAPIDSSADWNDVDAFLPEHALPLARADDTEGRALLRRLLLRALREGSVPSLDVQAQSTNEDRSANPEAEAYLVMVVNDLGAEVDERFEYFDASESFEVFVDPAETPDEEAALDEALGAIDRAASPRHEPLWIYQREFQRQRLLTAEEEVQLGQAMEAALDGALDALAAWPDGIARTLAAGAEAIAGSRPLSSIWLGVAEPDPEPAAADHVDAFASSAEALEDAMDEDGEPGAEAADDAGDGGFADALDRLGALSERGEGQERSVQDIRQALAALRLNRSFLLELGDAAVGLAPCPSFGRAMSEFRRARDRMTAANLKLAFFHAKKYLYSGEPLDDLAQEGNIGLLKAVDRYDWRRGFRFSTYATWWIRQQIGRHVADKGRTIRVPLHIHEKAQRMQRVVVAFERVSGREPTLDELAERMGMTPHKVATLTRIPPEPSRLDEQSIDEMIAIDARDALVPRDPANDVEEIQLRMAVDRLISSLSTRDRKEEQVLRLRFGIGVDEALTLDEVGQLFDVTRERIRQIEVKAIKKLRHPVLSEPFARLALGIQPEQSPLARAEEGPDRAQVPEPAAPTRHAIYRPPRKSVQQASSAKSSSLNRLLAQAAELGVLIEDGRSSASGLIWVNLVHTPDNLHRSLVRKLIEFGFVHSPGKGYWR